jgi:hypothetical protein
MCSRLRAALGISIHISDTTHEQDQRILAYLQLLVETAHWHCFADMLQNWMTTPAKRAFGHLRSFALAHMVVQEIPHAFGNKEQRRAERDSRLDAAREQLLNYAKIAEKV